MLQDILLRRTLPALSELEEQPSLPSPKTPALEKEEKPGVTCENVERMWWFEYGDLDADSGSLGVKGFVDSKTGIIILWDVMIRPSWLKRSIMLGKVEWKERSRWQSAAKWIDVITALLIAPLSDWKISLRTDCHGENLSMWLLKIHTNLMAHNGWSDHVIEFYF